MDIEALAIIVPSVAAVLLAGGTIWYQRWLTNRTLIQQAALTEKTLDHERAIARDQRVQERISSTYVEMLGMLEWVMENVRATQPIFEPGPEPPPKPDQATLRRLQALISAHGSHEVRAIISERWIPTQSEFYLAAEQLAIMRKAQQAGRIVEDVYGLSIGAQYQKVDGLRQQLNSIVRELEDRVIRRKGNRKHSYRGHRFLLHVVDRAGPRKPRPFHRGSPSRLAAQRSRLAAGRRWVGMTP